MAKLDEGLKIRDITLLTKVHIVKAIVFPVVTYRYESWAIKRTSAEELIPLNSSPGEDSSEPFGQPGGQTGQS